MTHDHELTATCEHTEAVSNCQHCGGTGWIGDIACPACTS